MSPAKPPKKTPPRGSSVQSDESRALQEISRRRAGSRAAPEDAEPESPPAETWDDEVTSPISLIDQERYKTDEQYKRDWDEVMHLFSENSAYRILWERSGRSRRHSDGSAIAQANAALAATAGVQKIDSFTEELTRIDRDLRDVTTVLKITKWILGLVIAAVLGSIIVVATKVFNWGMSTGEVEVRLQTLEREVNALMRDKEHP